jgi:hypothetical protein
MLNKLRESHGLLNAKIQHLPAITEKLNKQLSEDSRLSDRYSKLALI